MRCLTRIALALGTSVLVTSCGFWLAFQMDRNGGYTSDYYEPHNQVNVFIKEEKLETMGGPHSEATRAFVEDEVKRKGYCKDGRFIPGGPRREPHGVYWVFDGFCRPPG